MNSTSEERVESVRFEVEVKEEKKVLRRQRCRLLEFAQQWLRVYLPVTLTLILLLVISLAKLHCSHSVNVRSDCLRVVVNSTLGEVDYQSTLPPIDEPVLERDNTSIHIVISYLLPNGTWVPL